MLYKQPVEKVDIGVSEPAEIQVLFDLLGLLCQLLETPLSLYVASFDAWRE